MSFKHKKKPVNLTDFYKSGRHVGAGVKNQPPDWLILPTGVGLFCLQASETP